MKTRIKQKLFEFWRLFEITGVEYVDVTLRLGEAGTGHEASNHLPAIAVPSIVCTICWRECGRHPELHLGIEAIAAGQNADNRIGLPIDAELGTAHFFALRKQTLPKG